MRRLTLRQPVPFSRVQISSPVAQEIPSQPWHVSDGKLLCVLNPRPHLRLHAGSETSSQRTATLLLVMQMSSLSIWPALDVIQRSDHRQTRHWNNIARLLGLGHIKSPSRAFRI